MDQSIQPANITKPIQLLAAWLAGLLAIDSCFLFAAAQFPTGSWEAQVLTLAAIVNVPLFLLAAFLLQTRFRPELQEDLYYSTYISQKTNARVQLTRDDAAAAVLQKQLERLEMLIAAVRLTVHKTGEDVGHLSLRYGINKNLEDREAIARHLFQAGVAGYRLFGANSVPQQRVVAIDPTLDPNVEHAVLRLAAEVGFRKFSYISDYEDIHEQVLLGAYGDGAHDLAPPPDA